MKPNDIMGKLEAALKVMSVGGNSASPLPQRTVIEQAADQLIELAMTTPYTGPCIAGATVCDHPLSVLVGSVIGTPEFKAQVRSEIKRRFPMSYPNPVMQAVMPKSRPFTLEEQMAARMHWGTFSEGVNNLWAPGFTHMAMHKAGDKVHIWIITKSGESIVLVDDEPLYPSDAVITKIRLMEE